MLLVISVAKFGPIIVKVAKVTERLEMKNIVVMLLVSGMLIINCGV